MTDKHIDEFSGIETTGHEWDGLKELNNPLPRWWLWILWATVIWAVIYAILMPSIPLVSSYTKGYLGASQREQSLAAVATAVDERKETGKGLATATLEEIKKDPKLLEFAKAYGKSAFGDNCVPCHGTNGAGATGYPRLQDNTWLWGGSFEDITTTIRVGIRSTHEDTRTNDMTAFGGKDGDLDKAKIEQVADYVLSLSPDGKPKAGADLAAGKQIFMDNCTSCHGEDAKGNQKLGAPNLTDAIWLFGGDRKTVIETITNGRKGVMPTWEGRLDPVTIKALAVYILNLSGDL